MNEEEFNRVCDYIELKLESRDTPSELLDRGILKTSLAVSPSFHDRQSKIKFKKTTHQLDAKLVNRPDIHQLIDTNIIYQNQADVAPSLQQKKKQLQFQQRATQLNQKLDNRPSHNQLIDSSIIKISDENDLNQHIINENYGDDYTLQQQLQHLSTSDNSSSNQSSSPLKSSTETFQDTANLLESKLGRRTDRDTLIQNNIIKSVDIAPSIQATQSALSLKFVHLTSSVDSKLEKRPYQQILIDNNIIKNQDKQIQQQHSNNRLDQKLTNRPTPDDLINYNILKDNESSPSLHNKRNILKFNQTKQLLNSKVESRPTKDTLLVNHILFEDNQETINDNNNNKKNILNDHFSNRPSKDKLINNRILMKSLDNNALVGVGDDGSDSEIVLLEEYGESDELEEDEENQHGFIIRDRPDLEYEDITDDEEHTEYI